MSKRKTTGIAAGATILITSNFIVKLIGVIYKIPLANILGGEGMGYLSSAYEIYTFILVIFTSGGTIAVSKMIAECSALGRHNEARKAFSLIAASLFAVGLIGTLVMYFGGRALTGAINNAPALFSIKALSPAIFFLSVSCVYRGFFQGYGNMRPTGISQVLESVSKLLIGVGFALLLSELGHPKEIVSAGAISGTSISAAIGAVAVMLMYLASPSRKELKQRAKSGGESRSAGKLLFDFWKIALPISLAAVVVNFTSLLDLFLIFDRLQAIGFTDAEANLAYGGYKGYAQTLFNLPPSIIASINISIIPVLSAAFVRADHNRALHVTNKATKIVAMLALPSAAGLMALAGPIQRLLFSSRLEEVALVTPLLTVLGFASFWASISTLTTSILQATGKMGIPLFSLAFGGAVKLMTNYLLVGTKEIGIMGAPIGTILCYIAMATINILWIKYRLPFGYNFFRHLTKPMISSAVMGAYAFLGQRLLATVLGDKLSTVFILITSVVLYGMLMLLMKGVLKEDVALLPKGGAIVRILDKMHLIRA